MLTDELKELKAQLEASEGEELPEEVNEDVPVVEPEPTPEPEKEPEPVKEEPNAAPKEELDASGYARLRIMERENAALKKQMEDLKTRPAEPVEQPEQQGIELPPVLLDIVKEHQFNAAGAEFTELENNFRRIAPDYDDVSNAFKSDLFHSVRIQNPRMSQDQVLKETNRQILMKASVYASKGMDPIQEMYEDAKALGYKARPKEEPKPEPEKEIKPDLDKIAANKNRNAGMAATNGGRGGQPQMTLQTAASIPPGEWAKMSRDEKNAALKLTNAG